MAYAFNEDRSKANVYDSDTIDNMFEEFIVDTENIVDGAVTTDKIDDESITTDKLDDESITTPKLADGAVTLGKLDDSVTDLLTGNIRAFDTVADMQAATLEAGDICHTNGFHTSGDGGAAFYKVAATGTANGMDVLACGDVFANLVITESYVTPEMFGAWGDGITDDSSYIKRALEYLKTRDTAISTWYKSGALQLMPKTYLVDAAIIDTSFSDGATQININGSGTRSAIVAGANCSIMFDNQNKIGFSNFNDINFVGNDSTFLYTDGSQPQRLRFNRCSFTNFHMIADVEGTVDNSEFVFNQCAISHCGSSDNNCELFRFNNAQAVNWRFYATDIESFTGVCFHFLKGGNITFFQGSIIPVNGVVFSYDGADHNSFGPTNQPTATMYSVRYELRNSRLIYASFHGGVVINHIGCGMGGFNIADSSDTITLIDCIAKLVFSECYNMLNYKLNVQMNRSVTASEKYDGYIKFYDCNYSEVCAMIDSGSITTSADSYRRMLLGVYFNGQQMNGISAENLAKYSGQIVSTEKTMLTNYSSYSDGDGEKTNFPRSGFVTSVTLESVYTTGFGANTDLTAEIYNDSNALISSATVKPQSRTAAKVQINAAVNSNWYVLLKHTYGTGQALPIPHILYAEYLS